MSYVKFCKNCYDNNEKIFHGYIGGLKDECYTCPMCKSNLIDIEITTEDYMIIDKISDDVSFLEAMIDLKKKDPIEYQLKMSQFKANLQQQEQVEKSRVEDNTPKCPNCHSTNIKPISGTERAVSIIGLGIFSKKINKSFKCLDCKYTW